MKLRTFLITFLTGTTIAWISWLIVLFYIDPSNIGAIGLMLFYLSLCLALIGSFTLVGHSFRKTFFRRSLAQQRVRVSLRQAILFSFLLVVIAILKSFELTRWWNILLLIILLTLVEFFFVTRDRATTYVPPDPGA